MIIGIAHFHELSPEGREWILDATKGVPGVRAAYHAAPIGGTGYVSVTVFDDEAAATAATEAIAARRVELGIDSQGPDEGPVLYAVHHAVTNG